MIAGRSRKDLGFAVVSETEAQKLPRDSSSRFRFQVPLHWRAPVFRNPYAQEAEREVIAWFSSLGCDGGELERLQKFDVGGYVGIPFPNIAPEFTVRIGKYLSMWLLWDDVQIECLQNRWRIDADHVLENKPLEGATRFDRGWLQLFQEFAARRSRRWIEDLCGEMVVWNDAAIREAKVMRQAREGGHLPISANYLSYI